MVEPAAAGDPFADLTFVPSPETRASIQIQLICHIVVTGIDEGQEDLKLNILVLRPDSIAALQQLLPELVEIAPDLVNAQTILGLASEVESVQSQGLRSNELDETCLNGLSQLSDEERILTAISLKSILFNKYEV